jgi:hypothetical protein
LLEVVKLWTSYPAPGRVAMGNHETLQIMRYHGINCPSTNWYRISSIHSRYHGFSKNIHGTSTKKHEDFPNWWGRQVGLAHWYFPMFFLVKPLFLFGEIPTWNGQNHIFFLVISPFSPAQSPCSLVKSQFSLVKILILPGFWLFYSPKKGGHLPSHFRCRGCPRTGSEVHGASVASRLRGHLRQWWPDVGVFCRFKFHGDSYGFT